MCGHAPKHTYVCTIGRHAWTVLIEHRRWIFSSDGNICYLMWHESGFVTRSNERQGPIIWRGGAGRVRNSHWCSNVRSNVTLCCTNVACLIRTLWFNVKHISVFSQLLISEDMISTLNGAVRRLEYVWDRPDNDDSTDGHKLTLIWLVALAAQGPYVCQQCVF